MSWTTIGAEDESLSLVDCARRRMTVPSPRHTPTGRDIAALCTSQVRAYPALSLAALLPFGRSTTSNPLSSHGNEGFWFAEFFETPPYVHFFTAVFPG